MLFIQAMHISFVAVAVACLFDGQTKSVQPQTENEHSHRAVINDREIEMFPAN